MHSRGFQWFVVVAGAVILVFSTIFALRVHDKTMITMLVIFSFLYVVYLILFLKAGKMKKENPEKKQKQSPLMRR